LLCATRCGGKRERTAGRGVQEAPDTSTKPSHYWRSSHTEAAQEVGKKGDGPRSYMRRLTDNEAWGTRFRRGTGATKPAKKNW